jgi:hypothetical protein
MAACANGLPIVVCFHSAGPQRNNVIDQAGEPYSLLCHAPGALANAEVTGQDTPANGLQRRASDALISSMMRRNARLE